MTPLDTIKWEVSAIYPTGYVCWVKHESKEFGDTSIIANIHTYMTLPPGKDPNSPTPTTAEEEKEGG